MSRDWTSSALWRRLALTPVATVRGPLMNPNTAPLLTLFEVRDDRRDHPRVDARRRRPAPRAPRCRAICSRSKRGAPRRARASSSAARAWRSKRSRRDMACGIARWLGDSAVLLANSAQISALAAERDVLSGDCLVAPFMDVSTSSTAADQVRTGQAGLLLGLGAIPGVTGAGVTVAILDTGISAHPALDTEKSSSTSARSPAILRRTTRTATARTSPASSPATAARRSTSRRYIAAASRLT